MATEAPKTGEQAARPTADEGHKNWHNSAEKTHLNQ